MNCLRHTGQSLCSWLRYLASDKNRLNGQPNCSLAWSRSVVLWAVRVWDSFYVLCRKGRSTCTLVFTFTQNFGGYGKQKMRILRFPKGIPDTCHIKPANHTAKDQLHLTPIFSWWRFLTMGCHLRFWYYMISIWNVPSDWSNYLIPHSIVITVLFASSEYWRELKSIETNIIWVIFPQMMTGFTGIYNQPWVLFTEGDGTCAWARIPPDCHGNPAIYSLGICQLGPNVRSVSPEHLSQNITLIDKYT